MRVEDRATTLVTDRVDAPEGRTPSTALLVEVVGSTMRLSGEVDTFTIGHFRSSLCDAVDDQQIDAVYLGGVTFFGAVGISPLSDFLRCFRGTVTLSRSIERVLQLVA